MKNISKYMFGALLGAGLVACSPETFDGMNEAGIPTIANYADDIQITVDQSINQVTFNLNHAEGVYPVWTVELAKKNDIFTTNGAQRIYTSSGDYQVTVQIGNRNGISEGKITKTFHIDNSIVDFTQHIGKISKNPWFVDNATQGHLGCGPSGTDGTSWWSAEPNAKKDWGVYDNSLSFSDDMKYTFDPGKSGTIYVNNGCSIYPEYNILTGDDGKAIDFTVPVEIQESSYNFEVEGDELYLTFPKGTFFPYIANDDIWNTPRYRVLNLTSKAMELLIDNGNIAWHYLLTTTHEVAFDGFDAKSADNLWNQANPVFGSLYYAHGGSWEGYPEYTHTEGANEYKLSLPSASDMQWQAQYCLQTELNSGIVVPGTLYDFSVKIVSNNDLPSVTVKLTSQGDDPSLVNNQGTPATANGGEETIIYFTQLEAPAIEGNYKFVFDFGGNPDGTEITIKDICIIEHSKNTITPPAQDGGGDTPDQPQVDFSGKNLLEGMPIEISQYYADASWSQYPDAEYTAENGVYTITYPNANSSQWQTQFTFNNTGIALDPEKSYDFRVKIVSSNDHPGATVKLTQQDDDNTFLTDARHELVGGEETWIVLAGLTFQVTGEGKGVIDNLKIPFDFGGIAEGTVIVISDMYLQEHVGPKAINWDLTGEKNLWLKGEHSTLSYYYAPGWAQIDDPETSIEGNSYTISLPKATSDQWQAQWHISTDLTSSDIVAGKKYDIRFTIYANAEQPGITFKLTDTASDENFLTADRHAYTAAYEDQVVEITGVELAKGEAAGFKLALDFAGNPENSEITIKDIIIQEAE